ncbi:hypothetical protein HGRIS_008271 [Hohenbuehelia grisea]|uniref:Copper homeostasis protein cutC homolog n=1 Tax=Hohenbuehelia grisea TaxID=104357 RepID=A0ABR3J7F9_9AGAR
MYSADDETDFHIASGLVPAEEDYVDTPITAEMFPAVSADLPSNDGANGVGIEVCVDSVQSALNAIDGGADRLELCANLGLGGGTTPSLGLLKAVQRVSEGTPIMVMVRPRTGDFLYSECELDVMVEDIRAFKRRRVRGVVMGVLTKEGRVDVERTKRLVDEALPMEVCFHRAFDMTRDADEGKAFHVPSRMYIYATATISPARCSEYRRHYAYLDKVNQNTAYLIPQQLTPSSSGHGKTAPSSISTLKRLCFDIKELTKGQPYSTTILPGSGFNPSTVEPLVSRLLPLGLREVHLSGACWTDGDMTHRPVDMGMGVGGQGEWGIWETQRETVERVRTIVDVVWEEYVSSDAVPRHRRLSQ